MSANDSIVYVIDDSPSVRHALDSLLRSVNINVRTFASTSEFLQAERPDIPSCLVLDIRLPGQSGIDFQGELTGLDIKLPIVFVTGHGDIAMSVRAIKAGAVEFLTKPFRDQDLLDAIHIGLGEDSSRRAFAATKAPLQSCFDSLTPRERETMAGVVNGLSNKEIAAELQLSPGTVKIHRGSVMRKMKAKSVAELVRINALLIDHTPKGIA
jgi:FixJ family two-component response regulator